MHLCVGKHKPFMSKGHQRQTKAQDSLKEMGLGRTAGGWKCMMIGRDY